MNGNEVPVTMYNYYFRALIILFLVDTCLAQNINLPGKVEIEGVKNLDACIIDVNYKGERIQSVRPDKEGNFPLSLKRVPLNSEILLMPCRDNGRALRFPDIDFLFGFTRATVIKNATINLKLRPRKTQPKTIKFVDPFGVPVSNKKVHCEARIPLGIEPRSPKGEYQWDAKTDPNGILTIYTIGKGSGTYTFSISANADNGDLYWGKREISNKNLVGYDKIKPYLIQVGIKKLSLRVLVNWDASDSSLETQSKIPDERLILNKVLSLNDDFEMPGGIIRKDGYARFYDVNPGAYTIFLGRHRAEGFRQTYRITGGTEKIVIPNNDNALPVEHILTILPRKKWSVKGVVLDKKTGIPIENTRIAYDGPMTTSPKTDGEGTFSLPIIEGLGQKLIVRHNNYSPGHFSLPAGEPSEVATYLLEPLPVLRGTVTTGPDKKPAALAELYLSRPKGRGFRSRCNQEGEFSFPVEPGKYGLHIDKIITDPRQKTSSTIPLRAALYRELFTMPKTDTTKNFSLGGIAKVTINVTQSEESRKISQARAIGFLREDDTIMTGSFVNDEANRTATVYVVEGKYKVVVYGENEKVAALAGSVNATANKEGQLDIHVTSWNKFQFKNVGGYTVKVVLGEPVTQKP